MRKFKFRKSGRCEQCNNKYRIRGDVDDYCSKDYKNWMKHNREVQKSGIGAEVCWYCFRYGKTGNKTTGRPSRDTKIKNRNRCIILFLAS